MFIWYVQKANDFVQRHKILFKVASDDLKSWDADFVEVDQATLFDVILARLMNQLFFQDPKKHEVKKILEVGMSGYRQTVLLQMANGSRVSRLEC